CARRGNRCRSGPASLRWSPAGSGLPRTMAGISDSPRSARRDRTSVARCTAPAPTCVRCALLQYETGSDEHVGMSIVENKKAYHDYFVEEKFEAGLALEGWEVKAIRAGRAQLKEAYVVVKGGEIVLLGAHVTPLPTASTHIKPDPTRTRKLLLHRSEINRLVGKVERAGYTMTPLDLHFVKGRIKIEIGLARGKKQYDKRETEKLRDWNREKQRLLRNRSGSGKTTRSG